MDEAKRVVVQRWLSRAEHDLITARATLKTDPRVTDTVCFHAQQGAEKMLKAFLAHIDIHVEKTHDLVKLLKPCIARDPAFQELVEAAEALNPSRRGSALRGRLARHPA